MGLDATLIFRQSANYKTNQKCNLKDYYINNKNIIN